MSLVSAWLGIDAACSSIPQHDYSVTLAPSKYMLTYSYGVNRPYAQFDHDVVLKFICPSPPQTFRMYVYEKPVGDSATDPILSVEGYLAACGSAGTYLGTPYWFDMAFFTVRWFGSYNILPRWIHLMNYKTNVGSIGLLNTGIVPV